MSVRRSSSIRVRRGRRGLGLMAASLCWMLAATSVPAWALPRSELEPSRVKARPGEPGSGAGLEQQIRATEPAKLQAPLPLRPANEEERAAVEDLERFANRYRRAHDATAHTIAQLLVIESSQGKHVLETEYQQRIREHEAKARKMRALAIERYQDFLELHPDDATWTPEITFRLAELHFETSTDRLARQEEAFAKELDAYQIALEKDPDAPPPESPQPDYTASIALYRDVAVRFPRYHLGDAALYMMGTLSYEMENFDESRQSYLALTCANKYAAPLADGSNLVSSRAFRRGDYGECVPWKADSTFTSEAWLRVGEVHYDLDELDPALEAYQQAAADPEGELYDEALIRIAWTLYLKRSFPEAADKLDEFVRYADTHKGQAKADGAVALREDAIKYLAKTYVEEDWDLDGNRDRVWGFSRLDRDYRDRGNERHVPEIYAALGDLFAFQTEFVTAIDIWRKTLDRWPLTPAAPKIQLRIMQAYNYLQDENGARIARDALATNYLRGTKWFYANEGDPDVVEEALALAEEALVHTAIDHHNTAQELRAAGDPGAKAEYEIAARAYEAYLERFPDTPTSYENRFNFAESLYYSDQYEKAAEQYGQVRDSNIDNRLQEDAAQGAVLAYEAHMGQLEQRGELAMPAMPKAGVPGPFEAQEIPGVVLALQGAYDRFVGIVPDSEQTPTMMYLAGEISQRYYHFEEAERRFVQVLDEHCKENVAINAGTAILDSYSAREDLENVKLWSEQLAERGCGEGDEAQKFAGELKALGNAVRFKEATLLYEAEEFEAAADRFVALVDQAPDDPNADRALNNAAACYENIGRFSSASQTYRRIYTDYPDSEFADDALLRTGFNHSRFFEFDEAVASYLILADDQRFEDSEHREISLWNAADLLDNLQDYKRSAGFYQRYADKSEDEAKAGEALFRAAKVLGKTDDHAATIAAYQAFMARYGAKPEHAERAVEAELRIGQAYAAQDNRKKAEEHYRATVAAFETRGLQPNTDPADFPAEAQFLLAEYALSDVLDKKVTGTGRQLEKETKALFDSLVVATAAYDNVFPYRRIDWVLAAMFRRGQAFESTAIAVRDAPVPKKLKENTESWFAYKDMIEVFAAQVEKKAIDLYVQTVTRGKEFNIANEWTRSARERLNIYMPEEYPLLRTPALELQLEDRR
ncbi:tetratricopeptide repeat protein [Paraliomyxa miuraensis]|uniref:tetratricopeptide repeat protein n=1 Tax=Paraliomyxa miuraensis TaxID=376150 RepID=UPI00225BA27F|nr:tetratricopeptide repeat protein [Paraliomyxa miuraensis]MCX4239521.1 tetratricopeptide repeat protein [Paraliomyxa miuraensis]